MIEKCKNVCVIHTRGNEIMLCIQHIVVVQYTCCTVNDTGPTLSACDCFALSSDLNHMAFVIIVINRSDMQQEIRCARVKLLLVGLEKTENQRCSLESFFRTFAEKSCLNATRSSRPATGRIRSTIPSSSSKASHRSHKKIYL